MSDVIEVLVKDTVVVESGDNKVIVIEPKVIINQTTGGGTWGTITGDIGEQSDLMSLIDTKENKNRIILDSDNFDEVTANGKYSANYGSIMLDVANAYGQVFQRAVYQSTNEEKFRWQISGEWNDWFTLATEYDIATLYTALFDSIGDVMDSVNNKVDKVDGKELSTNDYTTADKNKLAGVEAGAQVNVIPTWNSVTDKPTEFPPSSHNHYHNNLNGLNANDEYLHLTSDEKLLLTQGKYSVLAQDFVGGSASPYQGLIVGGFPIIVKKFLNQNSYFKFSPLYINEPTQVYAIFLLTESVMPTAGQYIDFQINSNTAKRYTFKGTETQFTQIEVTDIDCADYNTQGYFNTISISGTYLQKIGVIQLGFIYNRSV